jgi:ATP dependent DNA ligase domain
MRTKLSAIFRVRSFLGIIRTDLGQLSVCLDKRGRPQFNDLLFHRGEPCFFAFDLLMNDGRDLRTERLTDRKHELRRLLSKVAASRMRYVEHVERYGTALFERVCKMDLEGIVAKYSFGNYVTEPQRTTWFKIKNPGYSQSVGREKLFDRERHREPVPGWHSCELACAEVDAW